MWSSDPSPTRDLITWQSEASALGHQEIVLDEKEASYDHMHILRQPLPPVLDKQHVAQ